MLEFDSQGEVDPQYTTEVVPTGSDIVAESAPEPLPNLTVEEQELDNWCWAATTAAVKSYVSGKAVSQGEIASDHLGRNCDLDFGRGEGGAEARRACDVQAGLTVPLFRADCHVVTYPNPVWFDDIKREIAARRPVCARVVWERGLGGGHFVVVVGYAEASGENGFSDVVVADSLFGLSLLPYEEFRRYYVVTTSVGDRSGPETGLWTHTYFLKSPPAAVAGGGAA